jgi:hypothetical protein
MLLAVAVNSGWNSRLAHETTVSYSSALLRSDADSGKCDGRDDEGCILGDGNRVDKEHIGGDRNTVDGGRARGEKSKAGGVRVGEIGIELMEYVWGRRE